MNRLELKSTLTVTDAGELTGIAWPFGSADSVGDIVQKGAFGFVGTELPMLYGHNVDDLIGTWTETAETDQGLIVKGLMHLDQPRARTVLGMIKSGLVSGLSIGFKTVAATKRGNNRLISKLDLYEVSIVKNPAHPKARITNAKSASSALAIAEAIHRATAALTTTKR